MNEHIENFNSEPCGRQFGHLLFSKERETGDQLEEQYNPNMECLLTPKYGKKKNVPYTEVEIFSAIHVYTRGTMILPPRPASPLCSAASLAMT